MLSKHPFYYTAFILLQEGLCDSKPGYIGRENENRVDLNRDFPDQFDPVKAGKLKLSLPVKNESNNKVLIIHVQGFNCDVVDYLTSKKKAIKWTVRGEIN